MSVPLSQQLSRCELLTRLKALRLERSTSRAGTDASEDSTEMNGGGVGDGAASTNCSSSNSTVNNNNSIVANHGDDDVTQLGLPSFLKKVRHKVQLSHLIPWVKFFVQMLEGLFSKPMSFSKTLLTNIAALMVCSHWTKLCFPLPFLTRFSDFLYGFFAFRMEAYI